jgi:hypothetical protein
MDEREKREARVTDSSELERQRTINWDHQRKKEKVLICPCPCVLRGVTGAPGFCGQRRSHRSSLQSPFSLRVNFILSRAIAVHHTRWRLDFFFLSFLSENANYASKSKTTNKFLKFGRKTRKNPFWLLFGFKTFWVKVRGGVLGKVQKDHWRVTRIIIIIEFP